ncbi:MAG: ATP-dependent Clp protease ATP-binding subunit [Candidatus Paceibacterota bacterium]|jgi:ATP-dependent Clp protease ATP-binding subunit ClpC
MDQQTFFLQDAYLFWPEWKRFFYRILFQVFIFFGLLVSILFILLEVKKYFYLGILFLVFFIFIFIKRNFSDFSIKENNLKRKKINLALFLSPQAKEILIESSRLSLNKHLPLALSCLWLLLNKQEIISALRYLDFTSEEIKEFQQKILQEKIITKLLDKDFFLILTKNALTEAQQLKRSAIDAYSLMLGLYSLDGNQLNLLNIFGIEKNDLAIAFDINILSRQKNVEPIKGLTEINQTSFRPKKIHINKTLTSRPTPNLDSLSVDFTSLAEKLKIGVMIGHLKEYEALVKILSRPGKRNILLIGPAGIGKETLVSYLAYNLVRNNIPPQLRDYRLINLSSPSLFRDTQTPFEACNRLTKVINEISVNRDIILYLPQLHNYKLLAQEGGLSALEILKPLFETQQTPIIAASTIEDFHRYLEQDSNIQDAFEIIRVEEISPREAIQILAFESLRWRRETKVQVSYRAIKRAVMLVQRFLTKTPLPSSAESLLTEAIEGARQKGKNLVKEQDIVDLVSVKTSIPLEVSQSEEKEKLLSLEKYIHQSFINQEEAVIVVSSALRQYRAGLANPNKPIGVFLFVGPTGVGKTELSKILARVYFGSEKSMVRFDMSEYQDQRGVFRFIGSPEGETSGVLTEAIKNKPFSLILLDEFEKANLKVLDLFLPLFDEGRLTDNLGATINFTNTIIIATSNALSDFIKKEIEKGTTFSQLTAQLKQKLTDYFKPELLNRFDEIVVFRPLTEEHLREIVKLKLKGLINIMEIKKINIDFDNSVVEKLAQLGYNPIFGARPLDVVIRHFIKDKLAQLILKEELSVGSKVHCAFQDDEFKMLINQ